MLYDAFGQRQVSTIYKDVNQYHVVMEVDPRFTLDPDGAANVYVSNGAGGAERRVDDIDDPTRPRGDDVLDRHRG